MKISFKGKSEIYRIEGKRKGALEGILPEWTDIIRVEYKNPNEIEEIFISRDLTNREVNKEYHEGMEKFARERKENLFIESMYDKLWKEEARFQENYFQSITEPERIKKILELIEQKIPRIKNKVIYL